MSVKEELKSDLIKAMKAKDVFVRETIRFLMSAIKQVEVDERIELSDDDIYKVIQKSIKQREDAASQYKEANRNELHDKEVKEAELLKQYLPKQLSDDEVTSIAQEAIKEIGATSPKEMGKVMKIVTSKTGAGAEGKRISQIVRKLLS